MLDITISSACQVTRLLDKYNLPIDSQNEITKSEMCMLSQDIDGQVFLQQFQHTQISRIIDVTA